MRKKEQKFMPWLLFAVIFSGLTGCSGMPAPVSQDENRVEKASKNAGENTQNSVIGDKTGKSESDRLPAKGATGQVAAKEPDSGPGAETKPATELSSEVLYYLLSAEIAAQRGQLGISAALYVKAAEITRDVKVARRATRTSYYIRNHQLSFKAANLWYQLEPENVEVRQVLGALLIRSGQADKAIEHFEFVLEHGQQGSRKGFMLITTLLSKEKNKEAGLKVMQKLVSTRQDNPDALYAYAQLAFLLGEMEEAETSVSKVLELESGWLEAYILQSNIFTRKGARAHALSELKKAVESQQDFQKLRMFYARKLVDAKQYDEATKQFRILLDNDSENHEARYALGLLALQMNRSDEAKEYFLELIESEKRVSESQYYLAQALELKDKLEEAIGWYEQVQDREYAFEASMRIAIIHAKQGRLKEARNMLHNISPDTVEKEIRLYLAEGEMLNHAKLYDEALSLFNDGLRTLTDNPRLLYARALTLEKTGKVNQAILDLEKIVEREPSNAQALNALGYTMVDRTEHVDKGFEYILKAYNLSPEEPAILDSMGWGYYRLGNYKEAIRYLRKAFAKLQDAEIAAHLGEVLWVAGDRDEAQVIWNSALESAPNDDFLLNVIQKFVQ